MADLGDAGEVLRYFVGFYAFLFIPKYRAGTIERWGKAGSGTRAVMILEGTVATIVGVGVPLVIAWLVGSLLTRP
jgi:hypothetical protein